MKYYAGLLAILLLLSGCATGVQSKHPLSPPGSSAPDRRLEGLWKAEPGPGYAYTYLAYDDGDTKKNNLMLQFGGSSPGNGFESMKFFVTRTPKYNFLNITQDKIQCTDGTVSPNGALDAYWIVEYHFSRNGELLLSWLDEDTFADAVDKKLLRGDTSPGGLGANKYTLLSDSPAHIIHFIETSAPDKVFTGPMKFRRIGGP